MIVTTTGLRSLRARGISASSAHRLSFVISALVGAILVGSIQPFAVGAPINYGSHTGTTVSYIDVTEDTTTGDDLPLFGAPIFSADSIDFNPVGFDASAAGDGGNDNTGARLTFMVTSHPGNAINNISFHEAGQATLSGAGTDATSALVTADGTLTINEVDGAAITPIVRPISLSFTPSGGDYLLTTDGGGLPFFNTAWAGSLGVNVAGILTAEAVPFTLGASKISIDLVNTLTAASEAGTHSLISKEDFGGISIAVNQPGGGGGPEIPEPNALVLAGLGCWVVGVLGRRRSAS